MMNRFFFKTNRLLFFNEKDTIGYCNNPPTTQMAIGDPSGRTNRNLPPEQEHGDVPHQRGERRSQNQNGVLPNQGDFGSFFGILVTSKNLGSFLVG